MKKIRIDIQEITEKLIRRSDEFNCGVGREYFRHKDTLLFQGNILNKELFNGQFIDLIVTSPPYNVGIDYNSNDDELGYEQYLDFSEKWMQNCFDWSKPQARFCLNIPLDKNKGGHRAVGADLTKIAQKVGWNYKTTIIWNEGNISRRTAWGSWKSASAPVVIAPVELIVVLYKDEWKKTNGSKISDVTGDEFKSWTQGVWVFNGESSGTTLLVAQNLSRKAVGTELDLTYCELAKHRILKETGMFKEPSLMTSKEQAKSAIAKLVERFTAQYDSYKKTDYNETQTQRDFIDPFWKALGWDIDNESSHAESYREVIHEDKVKVGGATKAPDYSFRLVGGKRLFFLEAKKPSVIIKDEMIAAYQVRRYGWSAKLDVSILTDFEEFAIYDCTKKPQPTDKASVARIEYFTFTDYLNRFDFIWDTFSKEHVLKGSFDKFVKGNQNKKGTTTVDKEFLQSLDTWRKYLANSISANNQQLSEDEINFVVQQTIDRIVFLRIAEDRSVEPYGTLKDTIKQGEFYKNLFRLFERADEKYNSGLFDFEKDTISRMLSIESKVVKSIISDLYYPESPYEFSVLSVDILGSAYEQFLGKVIRITKGHHAKIEEKPEVRKAGGVYYTPQYIVDYIVKHTVGKLVEGKTPSEVSKIKIVDPACGSGSFLLGAYEFLLDWHKDFYTRNGKISKEPKGREKNNLLTPEGNLTTAEKKRILLCNIFGVDIDVNAVEVTKLSLLLKCMEGETEASIEHQLRMFNERVLPTLEKNIKSGNSLIDLDYYDSGLDFGEEKKVKPFSWKKEFEEVFQQGGFDAVIGNPPYVDYRMISKSQVAYLNSKYASTQTKEKWSLYLLFIELGINILKQSGVYGNIIPNTFLSADFGKSLRKLILTQTCIQEITDVSTLRVFGNVGTYPILLFYANNKNPKSFIRIANIKRKDELGCIEFDRIKQDDIIANNQNYVISTSYNNESFALINKLQERGEPLENLVGRFAWGTSIIGFKSYKITEKIYNKLPDSQKKNFKKVIQTADIKAFGIRWQKEYINTTIYSSNVIEHFNQHKIVIARLTKKIQACIDESNYFMGKASFITNAKIDSKYLVALLNSSVLNYFFSVKFVNTHLAGGYLRFDIPYLQKLPIKVIDFTNKSEKAKHDEIVRLVEQLLKLNENIKEQTLETNIAQMQRKIDYCEDRINKIVYELYGLTKEEIKIVEGKGE
ncbi:hypothetical protein CHS0354_023821 [Potamilus streckersoni]|uniref:Uncharacterized protein n=1 Tax=Potamilus streckersoni TaxID=2493646 RepID=A0AAE0RZ22_9BIVA|nr:hypothetical protein CHS0354_023821 [Potamilus streckersoni]